MGFVCKIHLNICCLLQKRKFAQQRLVWNEFKEQTLEACNKSNYVIFLEMCIFCGRYQQYLGLSISILFFLSHF